MKADHLTRQNKWETREDVGRTTSIDLSKLLVGTLPLEVIWNTAVSIGVKVATRSETYDAKGVSMPNTRTSWGARTHQALACHFWSQLSNLI